MSVKGRIELEHTRDTIRREIFGWVCVRTEGKGGSTTVKPFKLGVA